MRKLYIDIETYSPVDLARCGVYKYAEHPDFRILMAVWSDGKMFYYSEDPAEIAAIPGLFDPSVVKVAHNAQFERVCLSTLHPGAGYLPPEQWYDTMVAAAEHGYPRTLKDCAVALGAQPKDEAGTALINYFCKPVSVGKRKGERRTRHDSPEAEEKWQAFKAYCVQDVVTLVDIDQRMPPIMEGELLAWYQDQRVNDYGIEVDLELAAAAVAEDARLRAEAIAEQKRITGLENPNSVQQLAAWLADNGCPMLSLDKNHVATALGREDLPQGVRRVLQLRQQVAGSAVKKYQVALDATCADGRIRGNLKFFGAHTGRFSGKGLQIHNLAKATFKANKELPPERQFADLEAQYEMARFDLLNGFGSDLAAMKNLIRNLLVGPFTVVDFSAIEARVIAWLADEQWAIDAFAAGRDIYVETGNRMGISSRQEAKAAVLGLGYGGSVGALKKIGAIKADDAYLLELVKKWRAANPSIVKFWYTLDDAFRRGAGKVGQFIEVTNSGMGVRHVGLPNGRGITYRGVVAPREGDMSYKQPTAPYNRQKYYGGYGSENLVQGVARDILVESMLRLENEGYRVVAHVHDEVVIEGRHDLDEVKAVMCATPSWAPGLPLDGAGFTCERYMKD